MNNLIQILLGSAPVLIGAIVILILKKKKIVPILFLCLQIVFSIVMIFSFKDSTQQVSSLEAVDIYNVYNEISCGRINNAYKLLNNPLKVNVGSTECTLAKARLYAIDGKWDEAYALYDKVFAKDKSLMKESEVDLIEKLKTGAMLTADALSYNVTNAKYLKEKGQNPIEYGFKDLSDDDVKKNIEYLDEFQKEVAPAIIKDKKEKLEDDYEILADIDDINKLSNTVMKYDYKTYKGTGDVNTNTSSDDSNEGSGDETEASDDKESLVDKIVNDNVDLSDKSEERKYFRKISALLTEYREKYPDLFIEDQYIEAYIMSMVRSGSDLDELLENPDPEVVQKIIDMYMSGIVTEGDFSEDFAKEYEEIYDAVIEQIEEIEEDLDDDDKLDDAKVDGVNVEELIEKIEDNDKFAFQKITEEFEGIVNDGDVKEDKLCESFLTLSIVENKIGNTEQSVEYFNEAVKNGATSSNIAIGSIMNTISETYSEGIQDLNYIDISNGVAEAYRENSHYGVVSEDLVSNVKSTAGTAVSQTSAMITIGRVDTENFPKLQATVIYSGDEDLDKMSLEMKDCGIEIKDYEIEKVTYSGSKVVLLCDVSGSMANSIEALQDAVIRYVNNMESNEEVCIVTFDSNIKAKSGFLKSKDKLIKFAKEEIYEQGGTAIAASTNEILDMFSKGNVANALVVMTDGEDNYPYSDERIRNTLGTKADTNNVTVYTIGLGENLVPAYLETIASACAGKFIYCSDESALSSAYEFIHKRTNCEYLVKFEAEDLDSVSRKYEIEVLDDNAATHPRDSKNYRLKSDVEEDNSNVEFDNVLPEGVTISGLDVNQIDKTDVAQFVNILGSGFDKANIQNVYLVSTDGESNCKIKATEDGKITFQIAPSVASGSYSVYVKMNDKKYKVDKLVIGASNASEVTFGAYHFKADKIDITAEKTTLSGNVVMNDFLYFNGTVELQGNINKDVSVKLYTSSSAYVRHDTSSYSKLDQILLGNATSTKAFDYINVKIFDDANNYNNYDEYETELPWSDEIRTLDIGIFSLEDNHTRVYPDRVQIHSSLGVLKDNTITDLATNGIEFFDVVNTMPVVKGEVEADSRLMKQGPFTYFNMDISADTNDSEMDVKIVDYISLKAKAGVKLMFDTYKREFTFGLGFETEDKTPVGSAGNANKTTTALSGDAGIEISIKGEPGNERNGDKYLNMAVALPLSITFYVEGVPVTLTDIKAELKDYNVTKAINDLTSGRAFSNALKNYMTNKEGAELKVSGAIKLIGTDALPKGVKETVEKWLGDDVSVVSLDDLYGSAGINYPYLGAGATLNVLGCIKIAEMEMELGAISYKDYVSDLLNASDGNKHYGFSFQSKKGVEFDWDLVGADIGGTVSSIVTVDRFLIASYVKGSVAAKTKINIFGTKLELEGEAKAEACAGVWKDNKWKAHATVVASADGSANVKVFGVNIIEKEVHEKVVILDEGM